MKHEMSRYYRQELNLLKYLPYSFYLHIRLVNFCKALLLKRCQPGKIFEIWKLVIQMSQNSNILFFCDIFVLLDSGN